MFPGLLLLMWTFVEADNRENLAVHKPTFSSTSWATHTHDKCVDGKDKDKPPPPNFHEERYCLWCTTHFGDMRPWWAVDLLGTYSVDVVNIVLVVRYSKTWNVIIELFDDHKFNNPDAIGPLCMKRDLRGSAYASLTCNPGAIGRFLRIKKTGVTDRQDPLCICEVFVYGQETEPKMITEGTPSKKVEVDGSQPSDMNEDGMIPTDKETDKPLAIEKMDTKLESVFECKNKDGGHVGDDTGGDCPCLCQLPVEMLPDKYQKIADDIQQKCNIPTKLLNLN